ncbi:MULTISPECIES: DUF2529 domain-containing protein [unclassified Bacillus (in: firmicutes)]|uniref:DUF2529 domain-containing protein n=1 Tax=unclassified Bacillus (in: firmicutes) TaxID=185979 RepID=UPI0008E75345|nr:MULTISPECIES: DUF2529 domain-containing protein [unclassified Bacillus (in: firmicutes)]SFB03562.1 Uncharacterized protein, contains SIS (Sugar ISomerase) phosphosugar binding domain [Bacillus sp. UNCCL13]SFQ88776.1 Uncharacterized protein, contains SIS (Sugar ISomerase) phosphosugar binding domain [Bacillus sp. cl95]
MLKMFTTQLGGLFKRIQEKQEFAIEDAARLLAQAPVGDGNIYIFGSKEMAAVAAEATEGAEPLKGAKMLKDAKLPAEFSEADRVLIISRNADDIESVVFAKALQEKNLAFVAVSTVNGQDDSSLTEWADVHIDLGLTKGLLPAEDGSRFGLPTSMAALFVYNALKFTIDEILEEY